MQCLVPAMIVCGVGVEVGGDVVTCVVVFECVVGVVSGGVGCDTPPCGW